MGMGGTLPPRKEKGVDITTIIIVCVCVAIIGVAMVMSYKH